MLSAAVGSSARDRHVAVKRVATARWKTKRGWQAREGERYQHQTAFAADRMSGKSPYTYPLRVCRAIASAATDAALSASPERHSSEALSCIDNRQRSVPFTRIKFTIRSFKCI